MDFSPTVFFVYTADRSQLLSVSADYETVWGRSCESLYQNPQSWLEAVHPDDRPQVEETLPRSAQGPVAQTYRITRPDGTLRWIASRIAPVGNLADGSGRIIGCAEDITEQKDTEQQLQRANRALRTLSECNQLVVRAADEATLLDEICRILVEFGGDRAARIGFCDNDSQKSVRSGAQGGYLGGYLWSV